MFLGLDQEAELWVRPVQDEAPEEFLGTPPPPEEALAPPTPAQERHTDICALCPMEAFSEGKASSHCFEKAKSKTIRIGLAGKRLPSS